MRVLGVAVGLMLLGCPDDRPPFVPLDSGPRMDSGVDAPEVVDTGVDASEDSGSLEDVPGDAPSDAPSDAPADANTADTACVMRADCDSTAGCETVLGTTMNCQSCGDRCTAPPASTAMCSFTTGCSSVCNVGFDDCDGVDGNGCEANINTSATHCGGCGMACGTTLLQTQATCTGGDCLIRCVNGSGDCDNDLMMPGSNGCEISTATNLMHCGGCGMVCTIPGTAVNADAACTSGTCRSVCRTGFRDCDGNAANGCETTGTSC